LTFTSTAGLPEDVTLTSTSLRGDLTEDVTLAPVRGLPGDLHSWCVAESSDTLLLRRCAEDVGGDSDDDDADAAEVAVSTTASTPFTADATADVPSGDDGNGDDGSDAGASDACGAGGKRGFSDRSTILDDAVVSIADSDTRAVVTLCLTLCAFSSLTDAVNAVISSTENSARMPAAQRRAAATSSAQVSHRSGGAVPFSVVPHRGGGFSSEGRAVGLTLDSSNSVLVFADAFSRCSLSRLGLALPTFFFEAAAAADDDDGAALEEPVDALERRLAGVDAGRCATVVPLATLAVLDLTGRLAGGADAARVGGAPFLVGVAVEAADRRLAPADAERSAVFETGGVVALAAEVVLLRCCLGGVDVGRAKEPLAAGFLTASVVVVELLLLLVVVVELGRRLGGGADVGLPDTAVAGPLGAMLLLRLLPK
jgi:hypothetical protein